MQIKKHKLTTIVLLLVTLCLSLGLAACSRTCSHSYSDWATSKVATCTESGEKTRACDKCGNEEKEKIAALGHDFSKEWMFDDNGHWHVCLRSNCTAKSDETNHVDENNDHNCDTCGKTLSGHTGGTATCQQKAACAVCGEKYGELDSTNHEKGLVWTKTATTHEYAYECCDVITVAKEAHEWQNGVCTECEYVCQHTGGTSTCQQKATCTVCGNEYGDLLSHNVVLDAAKGVNGYTWATDYSSCTAHGKCDRTGCAHTINATATVSRLKKQAQSCVNAEIYDFTATFTETWAKPQTKENVQTNDAAGHDYGDLITANPVSCTGDGNHAYFHCKACDGYFDENKNATDWDKIYIKSNGHDYGDLVHNPATCTESGYDDYYYCSACKTYFDAEKVPTTLYDLQQDAIEHVNNEYFESKAATCIAAGNEEYLYCPDCKNYLDIDFNVLSWDDDIVIAKVDHAYGTIVHNPATCTEGGYNDYYQCSVCKAYFDSVKAETTLTALAVSATGHHYTDTVIPATCSATGYTNHVCACGDNYKDATTAKIDHNCNDLDICSLCNIKIFELNFTLSADESYYIVSGIKHGKTATTVEIPAEYDGKPVREIGESAFEGNAKLTNVTIPESVTIIGANAFKDCTNLVANIGSQLTSIGNYAFSATAITSVTIPGGITTINEGVFYNCTKLANVTSHNRITLFDSYAFSNTAITNFPTSQNLEKIGESAFEGCGKLKKFILTEKITTISTRAFANSGIEGELHITDNLNTLGTEAFMGCTKLTYVRIVGNSDGGLKRLSSKTFYGCTSLKTFIVTHNHAYFERFGSAVFGACTSLESIDIPFVGYDRNITSRYLERGTLGYIFGTTAVEGTTAVKQYYDAKETKSETFYIPNSLKHVKVNSRNNSLISYGAFYGCKMIETISIQGVTEIQANAFKYCEKLKELSLVDGEVSTPLGLLRGCNSLVKLEIPIAGVSFDKYFVEIPSSLTTVTVNKSKKGKDNVEIEYFAYCNNLTDITIGKGIKKIGYDAFKECTSLKNLVISDDVTDIPRRILYGCNALESISIPFVGTYSTEFNSLYRDDSVSDEFKEVVYEYAPEFGAIFGTEAFDNTYTRSVGSKYQYKTLASTKYYIPSSLSKLTITNPHDGEIEKEAFFGCQSLTTLTLSEKVTAIYTSAFRGTNIDTIYIKGNKLTTVRDNAFNNSPKNVYADSLADWLTMPGAGGLLQDSGNNHIYINNVKLTGKLTIPANITSDGKNKFRNVLDITSVVLEEGVKSIGEEFFRGCTNITSVTFPNSLETINGRAFQGCTGLTNLTNLPNGLKTIGNEAFEGCVNIENISLPVGIESIGSYAFSGLSKITEINLGSDLKFLGSYAFSGCTGLTQVTIPDSVTQEQSRIFDGCTDLLTVSCPAVLANGKSLPTTVKYLTVTSGDWSFGKDLSSLVTLTIGDGVTSIGEDLCWDSTELKTVTIGSGLANWGVGAFSNCGKLESFTISANNPYLKIQNGGIYATSDNVTKFVLYLRTLCKDTEYTVAEGVTEISRYAFNNATSLKKVVIPSTCKKIGHYAFNNCTSLESAALPNGLLEIWGYAFYNCTSLKNVTLPDSLTTIDGYAFNYCKSITGVLTMSKNLTYLGEHAFTHCSGITEVNLNKKLTSYGYGIFQACNSLKIIRYYTPIPDDRIIVSTGGVQMIQLTD